MITKSISEQKLFEEKRCFDNIVEHLQNRENVCFVSGAGSGKTYALVETIRHILVNKHEELEHNNQKVICITYTNAAADEVRKRLGENSLVVISTIHDRLWDIIRPFEIEIDECHKEKIRNEIDNINTKFRTEKSLSKYEQAHDVIPILLEHKDEFYKTLNLEADTAKDAISKILGEKATLSLTKNIADFRKWVLAHIKLENLKTCLERMENGEETRHACYDVKRNTDQLHKMCFSHDTLLEYSEKLIERHPRLSQIIVDSYPYFLIDEYQDTSQIVLRIIQKLLQTTQNCEHNLWLGLFGDPVQRIYEQANRDDSLLKDLTLQKVYKPFNRRSTNQIIGIANKIRNIHEEDQQSIYDGYDSEILPIFMFCKANDDSTKKTLTDAFISQIKTTFAINPENRLHVFVLTNAYIAEAIGIKEIYDFFKFAPHYKGANFSLLNQELLSTDISKLGRVQLCLYKTIQFFYRLERTAEDTMASEIIPVELMNNLTINHLHSLAEVCIGCIKDTLYDTLSAIEETVTSAKDNVVGALLDTIFLRLWELDGHFNVNSVIDFVVANLELQNDTGTKTASEFLKLEMDMFYRWYEQVGEVNSGHAVIYHTYHSTKGLEFDNVAIILDPDFGRTRKNLFFNFFKFYPNQNENDPGYEEARNILYVAVTRAKKNLAILYRDDVTPFGEAIKLIFGSYEEFSYTPSSNDETFG